MRVLIFTLMALTGACGQGDYGSEQRLTGVEFSTYRTAGRTKFHTGYLSFTETLRLMITSSYVNKNLKNLSKVQRKQVVRKIDNSNVHSTRIAYSNKDEEIAGAIRVYGLAAGVSALKQNSKDTRKYLRRIVGLTSGENRHLHFEMSFLGQDIILDRKNIKDTSVLYLKEMLDRSKS